MGAAIGREFSYELLAVIAQRTEAELQAAVGRLVEAGLVLQRGSLPKAIFLFKHALVQDAAHGTLLRAFRRQLHARIAEALTAQSPELTDTQPELFAQHYAEAGLIEKSVSYWVAAGRRSAARSAMTEAAAQFEKGLDQLASLARNRERQRQELQLRSELATALMGGEGFGAPKTGQAYASARELWEELGSPSEFLQIPYGESRYYQNRGELGRAQHLAQALLHLSCQRQDWAGLVLGHYSSGSSLMFAGKLALARSHMERALALLASAPQPSLVRQAAVHPQVTARSFLGIVLFSLGYSDQGLACISAAIAEGRKLAHPASLATALGLGAKLYPLDGNSAVLDGWVAEMVAITTDKGLPHWRAGTTIYEGWAKVKNHEFARGISILRTRRYREHLRRGLSQFGSMLCWFLAVSVLSLGSATAIGFAPRRASPRTGHSAWARPTGFAVDSPLEEGGFEPSVPPLGKHFFETTPEPGN
jgi:hypothetical protein